MSTYEPLKEPVADTAGPTPAYNPSFASPTMQQEIHPTRQGYTVGEVVHREDGSVKSRLRDFLFNDEDIEAAGEQEVENEKLAPGDVPEKHLDLGFETCFHEHKNTKTFPAVHKIMGYIYKYTKLFVYHLFVILLGFILAFLWAIINGIMAFIHVWIYGPVLKLTIFWVYALIPLVTVPLVALFRPLVDVCARMCRQIRINATLDGSFADRLAGHVHNV